MLIEFPDLDIILVLSVKTAHIILGRIILIIIMELSLLRYSMDIYGQVIV